MRRGYIYGVWTLFKLQIHKYKFSRRDKKAKEQKSVVYAMVSRKKSPEVRLFFHSATNIALVVMMLKARCKREYCTLEFCSLLKEKGHLEDYENFSAALAARTPNPLNDDTAETSEDETELCYTRVHFTAKPGCQRDSGTCDGEETQYSEVQI